MPRITFNEPATAQAIQDWYNIYQYVAASTKQATERTLAAMLDESDIELEAALIAQGILCDDDTVAKFRWHNVRLYVVLDTAEVFSVGWDGGVKEEFKP